MVEEDEKGLPEIQLEAAPSIDPSTGLIGADLFGAESIGIVSSKLHIAEALLTLAAKDCKFNDFARDVLMIAMKVVKSEAGSLLELDRSKGLLFFRAVVGASSDKVLSFTIPVGKGIVGHVAESRQPLAVTDAAENQIHLKSIDEAVGFHTRNVVAIPVVVRGQLYGVLELLNRVGETSYTKQDIELLTYCAEMAAKAFEVRFMIAWALKGEAA